MATNVSLSDFPLFVDLPEELLRKIARLCEESTFAEGEAVFREGEKAELLHFLIDGKVLIKVNLTSRPDHITVSAVNQRYESFGWSGIVPPYLYTATAVCEEECKILYLPGAELMKLLHEFPGAGFTVMTRLTELISNRLRTSRQGLLKAL